MSIFSKLKYFALSRLIRLRDSLRSFYANRYSNYMLDKSTFLARVTTISIISVCFGSISWICFVKTDQIVIAQGKLIPFGQVKEIRAPENGVITQLLVNDGDKVVKGAPLIVLDNEVSQASLIKYNDIIANLNAQIREKDAEQKITLDKLNTSINSINSRLNLLLEKRKLFKRLDEVGSISRIQVIDLEDSLLRLKNQLNLRIFEKSELLKRFSSQINKLKSDVLSAEISLSKSRNDERYKIIRSPSDGIVFDLKPTSVGFLAQNREPILKIVPNTSLVAYLEVVSEKIGFIRMNDYVEINVDSFPANDFGTVKGSISHIGSDALEPAPGKRTTLSFPVTVTLNHQYIQSRNKNIPLQSGMGIAGHIKLRRVTYLQLLLNELSTKVDSVREL